MQDDVSIKHPHFNVKKISISFDRDVSKTTELLSIKIDVRVQMQENIFTCARK